MTETLVLYGTPAKLLMWQKDINNLLTEPGWHIEYVLVSDLEDLLLRTNTSPTARWVAYERFVEGISEGLFYA